MSVRRTVTKAAEQTSLTDFFGSCGRPKRASTKKNLQDDTVVVNITPRRTTRLRRDKISASTTSSNAVPTPVIQQHDIDYDFSPTKRPLLIENTDNASTAIIGTSSVASPVKRSRESIAETSKASRQRRSSARQAAAKDTQMIQIQSAKSLPTGGETTKNEEWLNDSQVREKLKGCKNWLQIKQQLLKINNCAEQVKQFKQMKVRVSTPVKPIKLPPHLRNLSPQKLSIAHLSPFGEKKISSPSKCQIKTPTKLSRFSKNVHSSQSSCVKRLFDLDDSKVNDSNNNSHLSENKNDSLPTTEPAYKRFNHLVETPVSTDSSNLPLPQSFITLLELFKIVDQLVWTHAKRHQLCTFKKLKEMVELYTRKAFEVSHLVKMQTIAEMDDTKWFKFAYTVHDNEKQLSIASHLGEKVKCLNSVTILLEREQRFHSILVDLVKKSHLKFLSSMNLELDISQKLFHWHPMFKLDSVPDVIPNNELLPKLPESKKNANKNSILNYMIFRKESTESTVTSLIKDGGDVIKCEARQEINSQTTVITEGKASKKKSAGKDDKFMALLEKVRAKEAAKLAKTMHRTPEVEREICMLSRMSEMMQIIYIQFTTSKSKSFPLAMVVKKITDSFSTSFEQSEVLKHLDYLLSLKLGYLPDAKDIVKGQDNIQLWLKKVRVDGTDYLLMDSKVKLSQMVTQIELRVQKLKS